MTPARLLTALASVHGLHPRAEQRIPPVITWDDDPCGGTAAATLNAGGIRVTEPFGAGGLADVQDIEPCVFQRVLRPEAAALLWLHSTEPDTSDGDEVLAQRVFATDLPAEGYLPGSPEDELTIHMLVGELTAGAECDFGGDMLFAQMRAVVRSTFGERAGLVEITRRAVI
ncbi:hypothetical protein Ait01nite_044040 [Actinoplanes italicus]|uniref:Uncharacterized protein n=1 Tax=Actinoplanes italicus TaxID=113567 RepID=A0A2T0KCA7_9ACTN|nr:hypothetical protein [Actinoplanes italicus]PRX20885.1 hypothetical protein CLV67_107162 [Actinoplanes italicus]GIE31359.1 hypothetical protein Ait01nite_044040 [Actinoplanes italicus]